MRWLDQVTVTMRTETTREITGGTTKITDQIMGTTMLTEACTKAAEDTPTNPILVITHSSRECQEQVAIHTQITLQAWLQRCHQWLPVVRCNKLLLKWHQLLDIWPSPRDCSHLLQRKTHIWKSRLDKPFSSSWPCSLERRELQKLQACWSSSQ